MCYLSMEKNRGRKGKAVKAAGVDGKNGEQTADAPVIEANE